MKKRQFVNKLWFKIVSTILTLVIILGGLFVLNPRVNINISDNLLSIYVGTNRATATPTTITTTTSTNAWSVIYAFQRKLIYAVGMYWIFYTADTSGTYYYRTSSDNGTNWSSAYSITSSGTNEAQGISVFVEGNNILHYVTVGAADGVDMYYRKGTMNSDNTVTWAAAEQTVATCAGTDNFFYPYIVVDSNGYPYIGYGRDTSGSYGAYVIKSSTKNGTWTTDTGFPKTLVSGTAFLTTAIGGAMTGGKTYWIFRETASGVLRGDLWDGDSWDASENVSTTATGGITAASVVADGDNIHIVFCAIGTPSQYIYRERIYGVGWGSEYVVLTPAYANYPTVTLTGINSVVISWTVPHSFGGGTIDHVFYREMVDGTWQDTVDWIDETTDDINDYAVLTAMAYANTDTKLAIVYMTKTTSPYNMKFNRLAFTGTIYSPTGNSGYWTNPTNAYSSNDNYATRNPTGTDTRSPTANSGAGWTNPTNAYADGTSAATQTSGGSTNTYTTYGFSFTGTVSQVRVRTDAWSTGGAANQTKNPTSDITNTGNYAGNGGETSDLYTLLDDTSNTDYVIGKTNTGGQLTFGFSAFTIPAGSSITNVQVVFSHKDNSSGTNKLRATLKVGASYYDGADQEPGADWVEYTETWATNPAGGSWTVAAVNGLTEFGIDSSDFNPDVDSGYVYIKCNYTTANDEQIRVAVSWDGGSSWSANHDTTITGSETTYWTDVTADTAWTSTKLNDSNFQVRVNTVTVGDTSTVSLDWIPVEVTYYETTNLDHTFTNYGVSLAGSTIDRVEVGLEGYAASAENLTLSITWNAGSNWSDNTTPNLSSADNDIVMWYDFTAVTSWDANSVNNTNLQLKITYVDTGSHGQISVDWLPIRINYTSGAPDISVSPTSYNFNTVATSSTTNTTTTYFTITNNSTMQTDQTISVTTSSWSGGNGWTHSDTATAGADTAGLKAQRGGTWGSAVVIVKYASPNYIYENCPPSTNYDFGLSLIAPTSFSDGVQKQIIVRITAASG